MHLIAGARKMSRQVPKSNPAANPAGKFYLRSAPRELPCRIPRRIYTWWSIFGSFARKLCKPETKWARSCRQWMTNFILSCWNFFIRRAFRLRRSSNQLVISAPAQRAKWWRSRNSRKKAQITKWQILSRRHCALAWHEVLIRTSLILSIRSAPSSLLMSS